MIEFFKSLQDHFTLPAVVKTGTIKCVGWRYHDQIWFEFDLRVEGQHDRYYFSKQFYGQEFEEHCWLTTDIPSNDFYEWWGQLSWQDKLVEIETFVAKRNLEAEINEHYQQWCKANGI